MRITIIGAGKVGRALGSGWQAQGHAISFGVRDPSSPKLADIDRSRFSLGVTSVVAASADVIVLATPWSGAQDAITSCGNLAGKIVLDATNPLLPKYAGMDHPGGKSGGARVAEWAIDARVVKIFNTTGFGNMKDPRYGDRASMMLYCGDDPDAKAIARDLAAALGFDPVDFGPLANAGLSESFAMCWIWLAMNAGNGPDVAFTLNRR